MTFQAFCLASFEEGEKNPTNDLPPRSCAHLQGLCIGKVQKLQEEILT